MHIGSEPLDVQAPESHRRASFGEAFRHHHGRALRLAYMLCGDHDAAEEAVADAFARVYPRYVHGGVDDIDAYLRQSTVNAVRSWQRRLPHQRRERARRTGDDRGQLDAAQRIADRDEVCQLLQSLPYRQRAALVLRYWEDLPDVQAARIMQCAVGTYRSLISRGLARLREGTSP